MSVLSHCKYYFYDRIGIIKLTPMNGFHFYDTIKEGLAEKNKVKLINKINFINTLVGVKI
jgi:hypothetical protein